MRRSAGKIQQQSFPAETVDQLSDLVLIDSYEYGDYSIRGMNTDVYGNVHEDWYDFAEEDEARAVFKLGGKYTSFEGMVLTGIGDYDTATALTWRSLWMAPWFIL